MGARNESPAHAALNFTAMESAPSAGDVLAKLTTVVLSHEFPDDSGSVSYDEYESVGMSRDDCSIGLSESKRVPAHIF